METKFKKKWLVIYSIILLVILTGITYAWFVQNASMTTLLPIEKPDTITISDINGSDMTELDLDYIEGTDIKDADGTIHIFRPLCIKSTSTKHQLEIVHTTNLDSLAFNIYPVTKDAMFDTTNPGTPLLGKYINLLNGTDKTAKPEILQNYSESDTVHTNAYALYWLAQICSNQAANDTTQQQIDETEIYNTERPVFSDQQTEFDVATKSEKTFYYTYYYLEISWQETTKETDLFYIMARNISD